MAEHRTFIISRPKQYVQPLRLKRGRYTLNFTVKTPNSSHKFAFRGRYSAVWHEFEIQNLIPGSWIKKEDGSKITFYLEEDVDLFDLCTSTVSSSKPIMIQSLMLEEGVNSSTAKPNEFDLLESIEDVFNMEHIFKPVLTLDEVSNAVAPESLQQDDYIPEGWFDDPITATPEMPFVIHAFRQRIGSKWGLFVKPSLYSNYAANGTNGTDAVAPIIIDGFWAFWNKAQNKFIPSEFSAVGDDGHSPIIVDGYWHEWDPTLTPPDYRNTWIKAEARDGISITATIDYYGLSNNKDILPTSWLENVIPAKGANQFLWNYEKITYSRGNPTTTAPRVIVGKDARGISHIKNAFTYSPSNTSPNPNQGWHYDMSNIARPEGYFLWMRDDIFYTDGTDNSTDGRLVVEGRDGEPGGNGLPGQIPIQKEWVVGDTHHNTNQIVDFIYVRGTNANNSYWYRLTTAGTKKAGTAPNGGSTPTGYQRVSWMDTLAVKVLIGEEANLGGFIFKNNQLISVRGKVNGQPVNYNGQAGFVPYIILDGNNGTVKISGEVVATSGNIASLIIEQNKLLSKNRRIEIDGENNIIALKDENLNVRTIIHPNNIPSIGDYFDIGGSFNADLSSLNSNNFTGTGLRSFTIGGSNSETHELTITGFDITTYLSVYLGDGDPNSIAEAATIVELLKDGVVMARLAEAIATSYADKGGATAYGGMQSKTFTVSGNATYTVRVMHSIQQPQGGATATSYAKVSGMTTMTTGKVVNRSEIGNNGMVIATSSLNYTYDVGSLFQVRRGNVGFQVTSNGVKKSNNMYSSNPTWTDV